MNRIDTKSIVQGAMIAALFGVLSLFNTYTGGLLDVLLCYFMVIPVAWYGYQYNIKQNLLVMIASIIVIFMFGTPFFIISSFSMLAVGVFLGEMIKRKSSKEWILLGTLLLCLLNNVLIYQVFNGLLGIDMVSEITVMMDELKSVYPLVASISLDTILSFIPMVLLVLSGLETYIIILICQLIFMRLKIEFPSNFHIATLHLSTKTGVILAAMMFGSYFIMNFLDFSHIVLYYVFLLSQMGFVVQGFSLVNLFAVMKKKRWVIVLGFLLFFIPGGMSIYVILGILDIFSDLRRNILYNS